MFCPVITKNENWEILFPSLVTFKRQDGVKGMKNIFNLFGDHGKM